MFGSCANPVWLESIAASLCSGWSVVTIPVQRLEHCHNPLECCHDPCAAVGALPQSLCGSWSLATIPVQRLEPCHNPLDPCHNPLDPCHNPLEPCHNPYAAVGALPQTLCSGWSLATIFMQWLELCHLPMQRLERCHNPCAVVGALPQSLCRLERCHNPCAVGVLPQSLCSCWSVAPCNSTVGVLHHATVLLFAVYVCVCSCHRPDSAAH